MKKIIKFLFLLLTFVSLNSFGQTANVKEGCVPLQVTFTAPAGSTSYYWDFKDGVTSAKEKPDNIFTHPGTYAVAFQESKGGPVLGIIQIKVYEDPVISIKVSTGCAPFNAKFQNTTKIDPAIQIKNYVWVFGDGQSIQGVENATHLYTVKGTYDLSFSIQTQFPTCNKTVIYNDAVEVYSPPVASFATNPSPAASCNDVLPVSYINNSTGEKPLTYAWTLGNAATSVLQTPPPQSFSKGQYTSALTISYTDIPGCSASTSAKIGVGSPVANITSKRDTTCTQNVAVFKTSAGGLYTWSSDGGSSPATALNLDSVGFTFLTGGEHTVTLIVRSPDGKCSATATKKIWVDQVTANVISTPGFSCDNPAVVKFKAVANQSNVTYKWTFADGSTATDANVSHTFISSTDSITYSRNVKETMITTLFVLSKKTGCSAFALALDTLWLPNARFMSDKTKGCAPLTVSFSDSSKSPDPITKWRWIYGDGASQNNTNNATATHVYTAPGEYLSRLIVTTQRGCVDTSYAVTIEVGKSLSSDIDFTSSKTSVCPGEEVVVTSQISAAASPLIDGYHFATEGNRSFHCSGIKDLSWSYKNQTGPQDVSLTVDYNGCFSTIKKTGLITVKGAIAKIDYKALCSDPLKYTFTDKSQDATSLKWDFGDAAFATGTTEVHTYSPGNDYTIKLTAINAASGCAATTDERVIQVRKIKAKITIDTLLCIGSFYNFNAGNSTDSGPNCRTGFTWQFPGSSLRPYTTANPSTLFKFDTAGRYNVLLIAKDVNGCADTAKARFKVFETKVNFVSDLSKVCIPNTVKFNDFSSGDTTLVKWEWNFADSLSSGITSTDKNTQHLYTVAPKNPYYPVKLIIIDKIGCKTEKTLNVGYYKPLSIIAVSDPTLCTGDSVTVSASGTNLTFKWDLGNNTTSTSVSNKILYKPAKIYKAKLIYTENGTGCKDTTSATISVQDYPVAGITTNVDSLNVLCAPQNVFFKDSSISSVPLTHSWKFGNGKTSSLPEFALFYAKGIYKAEHIVKTGNGCADTATQVFKVYSPEGKFIMDKNTICINDHITFLIKDTADVDSYTWAFGDGYVLNDSSPVSHRYDFHPDNGQTFARLIIRGVDGICPVELQQTVFIHEVIAAFNRASEQTGDTSICFNEGPFPFTNKSLAADSYLWNFGDATTSTSNGGVFTHKYLNPGTYDATLSIANNEFGCKDTISKKVVIYPNPVVTTIGDTICATKPVTPLNLKIINPVLTSTYAWSPATGLTDVTATSQNNLLLNHSVHYIVTETDINKCAGLSEVPAIVIERPALHNLDTSIVIGEHVTLPVFGQELYYFNWTPSTGLSCLDCNYPVVQPLNDIMYTLNVKDKFTCGFTDTYTYNITIKPETFVKLPTMFTPNGDGKNDVVYVQGWGIKELIEFKIVNRWGQEIFTSTSLTEGWDGKLNGIHQNNDVYVYKVKALTWKDVEITQEGYINLLH